MYNVYNYNYYACTVVLTTETLAKLKTGSYDSYNYNNIILLKNCYSAVVIIHVKAVFALVNIDCKIIIRVANTSL